MADQDHNLNAHPVATLLRVVKGEEYSQQGGGQADFWNAQDRETQRRFGTALRACAESARARGITLDELAWSTPIESI